MSEAPTAVPPTAEQIREALAWPDPIGATGSAVNRLSAAPQQMVSAIGGVTGT
ncbi:MAG TPA: hypothetical protein VFB25_09855 [Gaiellaceae bacterium]|nr:hypothetical protein [Gaiellaceae bacterium]